MAQHFEDATPIELFCRTYPLKIDVIRIKVYENERFILIISTESNELNIAPNENQNELTEMTTSC